MAIASNRRQTMASRTIVKASEEFMRALRWIGEQLEKNPDIGSAFLVSEAGPRFNLSPSDQEQLLHMVRQQKKAGKRLVD